MSRVHLVCFDKTMIVIMTTGTKTGTIRMMVMEINQDVKKDFYLIFSIFNTPNYVEKIWNLKAI